MTTDGIQKPRQRRATPKGGEPEAAAPAEAKETKPRAAKPAGEAKPKPAAKAKPAAKGTAPAEAKAKPKPAAKAAAPAAEKPKAPIQKAVPVVFQRYKSNVVPAMMKEFNYKSVMEVPRVRKVVLNIGLGEAKENAKALEFATQNLTTIAGQKPIVTKARKAISAFKIREGMPIGVAVTLRGERMGYFLDRLINVALPRIRDFRGVPRSSFDGRGNYSMGLREQIIFPEVDFNQIDRIRGFQITITTSAKNDSEAARMLELLGMPFAKAS